MLIGYARVSTEDQDTALQIDALAKAQCTTIFEERHSGADRARPELARMLAGLKPGDKVIVYKMDRLARSLADFLDILRSIEARKADFQSITETIDTKTAAGRMMMQMLDAFAEFERGMLIERTIAGVRAARKRGVRLGRPTAMTDEQAEEMARLYCGGKHSMSDLARRYGCNVSSIKRALARLGLSSVSAGHANCSEPQMRAPLTDAKGRPLKRAKTISKVLTDGQAMRVARAFESGKSKAELAREYRCSVPVIETVLIHRGLMQRPTRRQAKPRHPIEKPGSTAPVSMENASQVNRDQPSSQLRGSPHRGERVRLKACPVPCKRQSPPTAEPTPASSSSSCWRAAWCWRPWPNKPRLPAMTLRATLYARYSTDKQRETSIEDQLRAARDRVGREGWSIAAVHADEGISGSTPLALRPGGKALLADALAGRFDVLVLEGLDRLSREIGEAESVVKRLEHRGVRIIGTADGYDTEAKGRKVMRIARGLVNELYLDDLREKTHRGLAGQVARGLHAGGRTYGYSTEPSPDGRGARQVINESEAVTVRWVFEQYADGHSVRAIVHELNARGTPSARGGTWAVSALQGAAEKGLGMLHNELYIGRVT